ncbi:MAG: hypothetical protein R3E68_10990 [Burkholderiaceae bacterium]
MKFVLPFIFVFNPSVLLVVEFSWMEFLWAMLRIGVLTYVVTTALAVYDRRILGRIDVTLRLVASALLLIEIPWVAGLGLALALATVIPHLLKAGADRSPAAPVSAGS